MTLRILSALLLCLFCATEVDAQSISRRVRRPRGGSGGVSVSPPTLTITLPASDPHDTSEVSQLLVGTVTAGTFAIDHVSVQCAGDTTIAETNATGTTSWTKTLALNAGTTTCVIRAFDVNAPSTVKAIGSRTFNVTTPDAAAPTVTVLTDGGSGPGANYSTTASGITIVVRCEDDVACLNNLQWERTSPGTGGGTCPATSLITSTSLSYNCAVTLTSTSNRTTANALRFTGTDFSGQTGTDTITITRTVTLAITTSVLPTAVRDVAYGPWQLGEIGGTGSGQAWDNNSGGTSLAGYEAACTGLSVSSTGAVSGTATNVGDGTCNPTIRLQDDGPGSATAAISIPVSLTAITSHTYYESLLALGSPTVHYARSLRNQAELDAMMLQPPTSDCVVGGVVGRQNWDDRDCFYTYEYPGVAGAAGCHGGSCSDTYHSPKDGARYTYTPMACRDGTVLRTINSSSASNPTLGTIGTASGTGINWPAEYVGETFDATISGHSNADLNGAKTVTLIQNTTGADNFSIVTSGAYTGGTGGTIEVVVCDCDVEVQCEGSDSPPNAKTIVAEQLNIGGDLQLPGSIASSSVVNATTTQVTMTQAFTGQLSTGDRVKLRSHKGASPDLDAQGPFPVTVTGATTFTVPYGITTGGAGGFAHKWDSTDCALFTVDMWHGPEWKTMNAPSEKMFNLRHGGGGWFIEPFYGFDDSRRVGSTLTGNQIGRIAQIIANTPASSDPNYSPAGITHSADNYSPGGLGAPADPAAESFVFNHSEWTRVWYYSCLNQPDSAFSQWKEMLITGPSGAASTLSGQWTLHSMWAASESQPVTRVFHAVPGNFPHYSHEIDSFRIGFNTSATPPGFDGTVYSYFRNLVVLKNPTIVEGECDWGETVAVCSQRDVDANPTLFVKPLP